MKSAIEILIVEDEALVSERIQRNLIKIGYENITIAPTYGKALRSIRDKTFDLILLDIHLKHEKYTGLDIARKKEIIHKIPIIYISEDEDFSSEEILSTKPIHYLSKPFQYRDLEMAVSSILAEKKGIIKIDADFSYDLDNKNLQKKGEFHKLSPKGKLLLEQLIQAKGKPVPRQILESIIWNDKAVALNALSELVRYLRQRINRETIKRIPTVGYRWVMPKDET